MDLSIPTSFSSSLFHSPLRALFSSLCDCRKSQLGVSGGSQQQQVGVGLDVKGVTSSPCYDSQEAARHVGECWIPAFVLGIMCTTVGVDFWGCIRPQCKLSTGPGTLGWSLIKILVV